MTARERTAWPEAPVIYQVWPRSFRDTDGDGSGDLRGVVEGLDHVAALGADAVWVAPFFPSPQVDGGYDIMDHEGVDPLYGTLADFDMLVREVHARGLKLVIDQVFNHTSAESPWFHRSALRDPLYEDFYLWRDPKPDGTAPNNWMSQFGLPGWTWDHRRRQYFFHTFTAAQSKLNLRHERVQEKLASVMRFWRGRGVDGFRIDAVTSFLHDPLFRDNPPADGATRAKVAGKPFMPYAYQDHLHDILPGDGLPYVENLRRWAGDECFLLGEVTSGNRSVELALGLTEPGRLDAAYTTDLAEAGATADAFCAVLERGGDGASRLGWWLSSHDQPRHAAVSGDGSDRDVRFLATLLAAAPGPVILWQGEELGLAQPRLARHEVSDVLDLAYWPDGPMRQAARMPIPWTEGPGYGFTHGTPWMRMSWPMGSSIAVQRAGASNLQLYRQALAFRRDEGLVRGGLRGWRRDDGLVTLRYARHEVRLNFGREARQAPPGAAFLSWEGDAGRIGAGWLPGRTAAIWRL